MAKTNLFSASLLPLLLIACGGFSGESDPGANGNPLPDAGVAQDPKAPPVPGKPQTSDLVESLGVFVTNAGSATPDGTRARPYPSIQQGIDAAKKVGKRVYVCAGSYPEALVLADSISVIGGLDCSKPEWVVGAPDARSKVVSPTSPAITARAITSATKISGLDVVAPNATEPGSSSIGVFADNSPALVVASSSITAGDGAKGTNGAEGTQLNQTAMHDGVPSIDWVECSPATCKKVGIGYEKVMGAAGAISNCGGLPSQDGERGGDGGSGGLWVARQPDGVTYVWQIYGAANGPDVGGPGTSAVGTPGTNGPPAAQVGSLSSTGYAPADGNPGTDGQPGRGGAGGAGTSPSLAPSLATYTKIYRGISGAGGGGGGCPGLSGKPGTGGGASIALALVESAIVIEETKLVSGAGGAAGLGAFGSAPRRGGSPGYGPYPAQASGNGGNGGVAGTSSNGSAGPSFAIAHVGGAPTLDNASKTEAGRGGAGVPARTKTENGVGTPTSIAATPDGLSEAIHAF